MVSACACVPCIPKVLYIHVFQCLTARATHPQPCSVVLYVGARGWANVHELRFHNRKGTSFVLDGTGEAHCHLSKQRPVVKYSAHNIIL